jgi:hypothetical protein
MSLQESKQLVEKFISTTITANKRKFSSSAQQLAYERGLLTGLIVSLMNNDTYVKNQIVKKIDENLGL